MSDPTTSMPKPGLSIYVRSLIFNVVFVLNNIVWFVLALPGLLLPRKTFFLKILHPWCWSNLTLHGLICGVRMEFRGRENIPAGGCMVAAKHQSAWETLALAASFPEPRYILKRELMWVPLFGFYLKKGGQVPINRGKRSEAIAAMNRAAELAVREGGQLLVFRRARAGPSARSPPTSRASPISTRRSAWPSSRWPSTPASSGPAAPSSSTPARSSWSSCRRSAGPAARGLLRAPARHDRDRDEPPGGRRAGGAGASDGRERLARLPLGRREFAPPEDSANEPVVCRDLR